MTNPYTIQPQSAFWRPAVAALEARQIDLGWKPKFPITRTSKIITVGSCFAQHISAALIKNGFAWMDAEPAPETLPAAERATHGYGVFSFRTGNIYTPALLRQWVEWALGVAKPTSECFYDENAGRYFDPFRPAIPEHGFASEEELFAARKQTLACIAKALREADVLIFTLGLTEAWKNSSGEVYPMCPGTLRGEFRPDAHWFHNYDYQQIVQDLAATFDALRQLNPGLRSLLTVSPVPLTATATDRHVLTATTYSKSVLRAAAGWLAQSRGDVDYFPSYELIATPPFKAAFFAANLRSVQPEGVAFVMRQFFRAVDPTMMHEQETFNRPQNCAMPPEPSGVRDICEEIILDTWSNKPSDDATESPNILLIGDSQMGMIARTLDEMGIRYAGGAIMHGSEWHGLKFALLDTPPYFIPTIDEAKARWEEACKKTLLSTLPENKENLWVITNVGYHIHDIFTPNGIAAFLGKKYGVKLGVGDSAEITDPDMLEYLTSSRLYHLNLLYRLVMSGCSVLWVGDPPIREDLKNFYPIIEQYLGAQFAAIGCHVFQAHQWLQETYATLPQAFLSNEIDPVLGRLDRIHGSPEYYRQLVREILKRFALPVQYRQV